MKRFLTRYNAAPSREMAEQLADLEGISYSLIKYTDNVDVIYIYTDEGGFKWFLWSDGKLTLANSMPDDIPKPYISDDAVSLITKAFNSSSDSPKCGWLKLARIKQILSRRVVAVDNSLTLDCDSSVEKLLVEYLDGTSDYLLTVTCESENSDYFSFEVYKEGEYQCQLEEIQFAA